MPNSAERHHHRVQPAHLARAQEGPKRECARLHEVGHEQIQAIPGRRDCSSRTKSPGTVPPCKDHDRKVDECLKEVEWPKLRNDERRYGQGDDEKSSSDANPQTCL